MVAATDEVIVVVTVINLGPRSSIARYKKNPLKIILLKKLFKIFFTSLRHCGTSEMLASKIEGFLVTNLDTVLVLATYKIQDFQCL